MGRIGVLSILLACLSLVGCSSEPSFRVADGSSIRFSDLHGEWVVLNYWADWCAPCREEIPELNELRQQGSQRGVEIRVLGVNYDGLEGADLNAVMQRMEIEFPVLVDDPRENFRIGRAEVLPMTVVIDPKGTVQAVLAGPQTAERLLARAGSYGRLKTLTGYSGQSCFGAQLFVVLGAAVFVFHHPILQAAIANDDAMGDADEICVGEFYPRTFIAVVE